MKQIFEFEHHSYRISAMELLQGLIKLGIDIKLISIREIDGEKKND